MPALLEMPVKQIKYPISFNPELYEVAVKVAQDQEQTLAQFMRNLLKEDLKARGKWPLGS